jgi:HSP20 family molecular chaperone IbpA
MNYYISTPASMVEARRRMMNRFLNENKSEEPVFSIPMNLYSNQDEYLLTSFVPGLEADSLNIHFNNGVLTLEGEYAEKQVEGYDVHISELPIGKFSRSIEFNNPSIPKKLWQN